MKVLLSVQVLAVEREATPLEPQLMLTWPRPEVGLEITNELLSKDRDETL